jgi:hypothetical protein
MNNQRAMSSIERAKAVVICLIEARDQLSDKDIESNLFTINSLLCDASEHGGSTTKAATASICDIADDIFNVLHEAEKMKETACMFLDSCFTNKDNGSRNLIMTSALADYAINITRLLEELESKIN